MATDFSISSATLVAAEPKRGSRTPKARLLPELDGARNGATTINIRFKLPMWVGGRAATRRHFQMGTMNRKALSDYIESI